MSQMEDLTKSVDALTKEQKELRKALIGDPLDPQTPPGLVQEVQALKKSFKYCPGNGDRKRIWAVVGFISLAVLVLYMWMVTGAPKLP